MPGLHWDVFCRVVDNFGDIGVCWRLAADLAARGEQVRLWTDDASALAWMAPGGQAGVDVIPWTEAASSSSSSIGPGDVVVEAFGCDPPASFVAAMARRAVQPVWINLEYLSAEDYVDRSHGLRSPQQSGPGAGLTKWFFYPGFTPATGGLLREPGLLSRQAAFDPSAWLAAQGIAARPGERVVSLFCYRDAPLPALIDVLASLPTLLLVAAGSPTQLAEGVLGAALKRGLLRAQRLPWLAQSDYDHLLWSCDLNLVRGEDSFVRAQWAARPFVWQAYRQADELHEAKVDAFLDRMLDGADAALARSVREVHRAWNAARSSPVGARFPSLPQASAWRHACVSWRACLQRQVDLATQLMGFVSERR